MNPKVLATVVTAAACLGLLVFAQADRNESAENDPALTQQKKGKQPKKKKQKVGRRRSPLKNAEFIKQMLDAAKQDGSSATTDSTRRTFSTTPVNRSRPLDETSLEPSWAVPSDRTRCSSMSITKDFGNAWASATRPRC